MLPFWQQMDDNALIIDPSPSVEAHARAGLSAIEVRLHFEFWRFEDAQVPRRKRKCHVKYVCMS